MFQLRSAENSRNYTQSDSLLLGKDSGAHTVPYIEEKNPGKKWSNGTFLKVLNDMTAAGDLIKVKASFKLSPEFKKKLAVSFGVHRVVIDST